ncbi:Retrotransposon-derived protein PEG10 AltName: Full=Embryonal carcinoma differentiation regulated protein [Rhizoctonia solani AG-1 IB]|uniref:Rhizoctonia solani AG1-IB WGS project CAOJ00000000 data, isolate 7/3/14, contig 23564 n=2 Tax=Thanatephorus cucumeris (strain AG1-IB / isolate 7/3/14) TaxID=1108050 RepID=M5CH47_THACB|nr:Retrotransposon-derived protein PEG10 AltName: Full=Embryonal carcinoma differentiation regulated protein [Rhizoctonia solani AG-1 IB]
MATNSRPASCNSNRDPSVGGILQEADQNEALGIQGASLESIQRLVILLTGQVASLSQQIRDRDQEFQDLRAMVEETNQAVTRAGPSTPEVKPAGTDVHQTPKAFGLWDNKPNPALATAATINPAGTSQRALPSFALPSNPIKPPPSSHSITSSRRSSCSRSPLSASTAPTLGALTKVKVKAPEPYKGGIGADAKQWLARMMGWLTISGSQFASNKDIIMFLLINMEGTAAAWALPHIALIGEKKAVIKTPDDFQREFRKAFDDPDATAAAERKITKLVQTTTAAAYTAEFRTLQLEIEWNESALRAQYQRGLNWQVRTQMAMMTPQPSSLEDFMEAAVRIDNVRCELEASRPPRDNKPSNPSKSSSAPNKGTSTGSPVKPGNPHYVSKEEIEKRRANNQCIKCGREGHRAAVCRTGWKAPGELKPKEEKGKEMAKIAEAEPESENE